jgi:hypothetical protein
LKGWRLRASGCEWRCELDAAADARRAGPAAQANIRNLVEIGRVCLINYGDQAGKLCTIVDVIDQNAALVDGPQALTGVHRQSMSLRNLSLTPFKVRRARRRQREGRGAAR